MAPTKDHLRNYLDELQATLASLDLEAVESCRRQIAEARDRGSRIYLCGNGGSAATASHMANDLGKGASLGHPREKRFRVTALTDNVSWMTALANDVDYDSIFSEQLRNLGEADDLLIAISGSGNSPNVLDAVAAAREAGDADDRLDGFRGRQAGRSRRSRRRRRQPPHGPRRGSPHRAHARDLLLLHGGGAARRSGMSHLPLATPRSSGPGR